MFPWDGIHNEAGVLHQGRSAPLPVLDWTPITKEQTIDSQGPESFRKQKVPFSFNISPLTLVQCPFVDDGMMDLSLSSQAGLSFVWFSRVLLQQIHPSALKGH